VQPRTDPKLFRQRFLDAAWKLGTAGGADAVKIRAIAEDVGVSAALIYAYFEDKASLMAALQAIGAARFEAMLADRSTGEPDAALLRLCECYLDYMREHAWLYAGSSGMSVDSLHVRTFVERAMALLDAPARAAAATHLWIGVQGLFAACEQAPRLATQTTVHEHLELLIDAVRSARRFASE
jgi:AcrR family transcriptional regulator